MTGFDNTIRPFESEEHVKPESEGPAENRSCRDVVFLILLFMVLGGMCYTSYVSMLYGDPYRLAFGVDSWGNVCNKKNVKIPGVERSGRDLRGINKLFFFDESILNNYVIGQTTANSKPIICVSSCPSADISTYVQLQNYSQNAGINYCLYDYKLAGNSSDVVMCPNLPISKQKSILFRCVPSTLSATYDFLIGFIDNLLNSIDENFTQKCLSDLENAWREICYLCAIGFGVSLLIVHLMKFVAGIIIWLAMFVLGAGSIVGTALCWYNYYRTEIINDDTETKWLTASVCATVIMLIILLILLILRKRIALVVQLFKEAGKALGDMPLLIFQPVWTFICLAIALIVLLFFCGYILSAEHPVVNPATGFVSFEKDNILKYLKWYYLFGCVWVIQFMFACETIVISGAVGKWYFSRNKSKLKYPVFDALKELIRFNLGSAAFGSLIITIVFALRISLQFVQNRLKNKTGPVVNFFLKCFKCCLWCFDKFIRFLNSNAYVEIAITGNGFCTSAKRAFRIVVGNALRLATINSVGDFTLFLGKLAPISTVAVVGLELLARRSDIYYPWFPITVACVVTFLIASCFFGIYEKCIDTLFVCFCEDCEINDGEQRPYFMSAGLMKFVKGSNV